MSPDPQVQETIHRHGRVALFAQAPALALIGAPLLAEGRTREMHAALNDLGQYPPGAMDHAQGWLEERLNRLETVQLATALGLDARDVHDQLVGLVPDIREMLLQIAHAKLDLTFSQLRDELGGAAGLRFDSAQASYALAVLAVALSARDVSSLEVPITHVRGGLYMPAIVVLLSTIFLMEVGS